MSVDTGASPRAEELGLLRGLVDRYDRDMPDVIKRLGTLESEVAVMKSGLAEQTNLRNKVSDLERRIDRQDVTGRLIWAAVSALGAGMLVLLGAVLPTLLTRLFGE